MNSPRDDDETPVEPLRAKRISTQITAWGRINAWLALETGKGGPRPLVSFGLDPHGRLVAIVPGVLDELVKDDEDPSVACMRAIGKRVGE